MSSIASTARSPLTLRGALARPAVRLVLVSSLIFLSCLLYARAHFFRDPGSAFYDASRAYERRYSLIREAQTRDFLAAAEQGSLNYAQSGSNAQLCAAVVSVKRDVPRQYIINTLGSLLANLTVAERKSMRLAALFADSNPAQNPVFSQAWLDGMLDDLFTYSSAALSDGERTHLRDLEEHGGLGEKGILDYSLVLKRCLDTTTAPYIAVFEDDILMADGWLARLMYGLHDAEELMQRSTGDASSWLDLRLFNQERSTGWASRRIGGNNEAQIAFGAALCLTLVFLLARRALPSSRKALTPGVLVVLCLLVVPAFVVLFFQCGKASVLPPAAGVREENFGCCSQAMVFNRKHVPGLIEYLREHRSGPTRYDMLTRDYARESGLRRLSMYPMMAQHVGIESATRTSSEEAQAVWSMAFESLDAARLAREHNAMAEEIFGRAAAANKLQSEAV